MNVESLYNKRCFGGTIPLASDDEVHSSFPLVNRNDPVCRIVVGDNLLAPNGSSENIFDVNNNRQVLVESVTIDIDVISKGCVWNFRFTPQSFHSTIAAWEFL